MRFRYLASFDRSFKKLPHHKQTRARLALKGFLNFYEDGTKPEGLGLKKLRKDYWEIRVGLDIRIVFSVQKNLVTFILTGTHDDIKQFLKRS